jgi:hypothetical protein
VTRDVSGNKLRATLAGRECSAASRGLDAGRKDRVVDSLNAPAFNCCSGECREPPNEILGRFLFMKKTVPVLFNWPDVRLASQLAHDARCPIVCVCLNNLTEPPNTSSKNEGRGIRRHAILPLLGNLFQEGFGRRLSSIMSIVHPKKLARSPRDRIVSS